MATADRRLRLSLLAATLLFAAATVALASVPPRPLRSALTVVYTLSVRVATDWLVVVALLAVADGYVRAPRSVDRTTVTRLGAVVFLGALALEAAPLVRLVFESTPVGFGALVRGFSAAVQGALFPTGLFLATVAGASRLREAGGGETRGGRLPLSPAGGARAVSPAAVWRTLRVLVGVAVCAFLVEAGARLLVGTPYPWLVALDAAVVAASGSVDAAVLAVAFLVLVVEGAHVRSLAAGVVGVWTGLFVLGVVVAVAGAGLAVGLVGATTTPMAAVEGSTLGEWPTPDSWAVLLGLATFVAGGVGLATIQRWTPGDRTGGADAGVTDT